MSKDQPAPEIAAEFSRPIAVRDIDEAGCDVAIEANPAERLALAARFSLNRLDSLTASLRLSLRRGGKAVWVTGSFAADVEQTCVVSLEPVRTAVAETISVLFMARDPDMLDVDVADAFEEDEAVEPLEGDSIDLGELVAQNVYLALDQYPRAPDVHLDLAAGEPSETGVSHPFAELAHLRRDG